MKIGDKIKRSRQGAGLGLTEAAIDAGISKAGLWKIETGRTKMPDLATLRTLAAALGVDFTKWLWDTDADE